MKSFFSKTLTCIGLAALATAPAVAQDFSKLTDLKLDQLIAPEAPAGSAPWVNIRIYDLEFLEGTDFASLAPTVEFQVTTKPDVYDEPPLGGCCPMAGLGNLAANEQLITLNMSVNPALFVPGAELKVEWAGGAPTPGFPDSGQAPSSILLSSQPGVTPYDITISWDESTFVTHSKFLVSYYVNGALTDIDHTDLAVINQTGYSAQGVILYRGVEGNITGAGVIGAVPEPGTYAMLGLGLLGVGAMVRRRRS